MFVCLPMQDVQSSSAHGNYIADHSCTCIKSASAVEVSMDVEVGTPESPAISPAPMDLVLENVRSPQKARRRGRKIQQQLGNATAKSINDTRNEGS